jgi:hypothetical protein
MASIGGQGFEIMRGHPAPQKLRTEVWQVPGIDGYGVQTLGMGDSEFPLTTITYVADNAAAEALITACAALQGTLVSITDDCGNTFTNILVKEFDPSKDLLAKQPVIAAGYPAAFRVEFRWLMVQT